MSATPRRDAAIQRIKKLKARKIGRPPEAPHDVRLAVAWACVEFFRKRSGRLGRHSIRKASNLAAAELGSYIKRAPKWPYLKNLHGQAATKMSSDDVFRGDCERELARFEEARRRMGAGFTIPEYLELNPQQLNNLAF